MHACQWVVSMGRVTRYEGRDDPLAASFSASPTLTGFNGWVGHYGSELRQLLVSWWTDGTALQRCHSTWLGCTGDSQRFFHIKGFSIYLAAVFAYGGLQHKPGHSWNTFLHVPARACSPVIATSPICQPCLFRSAVVQLIKLKTDVKNRTIEGLCWVDACCFPRTCHVKPLGGNITSYLKFAVCK